MLRVKDGTTRATTAAAFPSKMFTVPQRHLMMARPSTNSASFRLQDEQRTFTARARRVPAATARASPAASPVCWPP